MQIEDVLMDLHMIFFVKQYGCLLYLDDNSIQHVNRVRDGGKYANAQIGDYAIQRMFDDWDMANNVAVTSGQDISNTSNTNPAAKVLERDRNDYKFKIYGSMYMKYKIAKGINFKIYYRWRFSKHKARSLARCSV